MMNAESHAWLWAPEHPFPAAHAIEPVTGMRSAIVHRPDADYAFLHDCCVAWHGGILYAAWYNCPRAEMQDASVIRGRRSRDGGSTWSGVETLSADPSGRFLHVPAVLCACGTGLIAWVSRMTAPDVPFDLLAYRVDAHGQWQACGTVARRFIPNCPPVPTTAGQWVMAGRMAAAEDERALHPAVAICPKDELPGPWDVVRLQTDGTPMACPETTVLPHGNRLTAIVRPGDWVPGDPGRQAWVAVSEDGGRTWSSLQQSNFPMQPSKAFAGRLSSGQGFVISNSPGRGGNGRTLLTIALTQPGEQRLSRVLKIRDGFCNELNCGPEWSYPYAVEYDGHLFVVYTSEKQNAVLSVLPLASLAV